MENVFHHHFSNTYILCPLWYPNSLPIPLAWLCSPWQEDHYTLDCFDTTNPILSPYLLLTLFGSHSADLQQPRTASPRYHNTLVLCCCPVPCGRRVFNTQALSVSPFVFQDVILRVLQVWASRASEDDIHSGTQIFLVREISM